MQTNSRMGGRHKFTAEVVGKFAKVWTELMWIFACFMAFLTCSGFPVEHLGGDDDAGNGVYREAVAVLVDGLDERVGHVTIRAGVRVLSPHL